MTGPRVNSRYVVVEDRQGLGLPYSKGLMATSIMATGLPPDRAFALAEDIEKELLEGAGDRISADDLAALATQVLTERAGREVAARYESWRKVKRAAKPIVVLIGGAPGVGKSTVATRVGARLGITRIIPTDAVREVMRNIISADVMPSLHVSSFEVRKALRGQWYGNADPVLAGFQRQAEAVSAGLTGLIDRAATERVDIVIEGTHVVPGALPVRIDPETVSVVEVLLTIDDPDTHRAHFLARPDDQHGRRPERYLEHFLEIRAIQDHLRRTASAQGVLILPSADLDGTIQAVLDEIVRVATGDRSASRLGVVAG